MGRNGGGNGVRGRRGEGGGRRGRGEREGLVKERMRGRVRINSPMPVSTTTMGPEDPAGLTGGGVKEAKEETEDERVTEEEVREKREGNQIERK